MQEAISGSEGLLVGLLVFRWIDDRVYVETLFMYAVISCFVLPRNAGLRLVLSVSPFVSTESRRFREATEAGILVTERNTSSNIPALTWFKVRS